MEGDGKEAFKQVILPKIVIALVAELKEILYLLCCVHVKYVVQGGAVESGYKL